MKALEAMLALIFVSDEPAKIEALAEALELSVGEARRLAGELESRLAERGPFRLAAVAGGYQLVTAPEFAERITTYLAPRPRKLGRSVMEVLALIAFRQPTTLPEIDAARGVKSDYGLKVLLDRGLIAECGRRESPGRPTIYRTTDEFLIHFGLSDLSQLATTEPGTPSLPPAAVVI